MNMCQRKRALGLPIGLLCLGCSLLGVAQSRSSSLHGRVEGTGISTLDLPEILVTGPVPLSLAGLTTRDEARTDLQTILNSSAGSHSLNVGFDGHRAMATSYRDATWILAIPQPWEDSYSAGRT